MHLHTLTWGERVPVKAAIFSILSEFENMWRYSDWYFWYSCSLFWFWFFWFPENLVCSFNTSQLPRFQNKCFFFAHLLIVILYFVWGQCHQLEHVLVIWLYIGQVFYSTWLGLTPAGSRSMWMKLNVGVDNSYRVMDLKQIYSVSNTKNL